MLLYFTRKRRDIPFRHLFWLFGAFIILCGFTHFMEFYTFYSPIYRFSGLIKLLTAIASWGTVLALIPVTPRALAMRSPEQLEQEIAKRTNELQQINEELTIRHKEIAALNKRLHRAMEETHHRVKNNLQVVSALVDLQVMSEEPTVSKAEMKRVAQHIRSLALIHELLTTQAKSDAEVEFVNTREALQRLLPIIQELLKERRIYYHVDNILLPVKHTTAVAVLLNELVSNAVKHGQGDILIEIVDLGRTGDSEEAIVPSKVRLRTCDQGPGFPDDFDPTVAANTGLELVDSLTRWDLNGEPHYFNRPEGGACVEVVFELDGEEHAVHA